MKEACKPNKLREERKRRREKMGDGAEERWRKVTRHPLSQEGRTDSCGSEDRLLWTFRIQRSRADHREPTSRRTYKGRKTEEQKETRSSAPQLLPRLKLHFETTRNT